MPVPANIKNIVGGFHPYSGPITPMHYRRYTNVYKGQVMQIRTSAPNIGLVDAYTGGGFNKVMGVALEPVLSPILVGGQGGKPEVMVNVNPDTIYIADLATAVPPASVAGLIGYHFGITNESAVSAIGDVSAMRIDTSTSSLTPSPLCPVLIIGPVPELVTKGATVTVTKVLCKIWYKQTEPTMDLID